MALKYAIIRTNDTTNEIHQVLYTDPMIERITEKILNRSGWRCWFRKYTRIKIEEAFEEIEYEAELFTTQI